MWGWQVTNPTPSAMRAAEAIVQIRDDEEIGRHDAASIARIIDAETGLAELVRVLRTIDAMPVDACTPFVIESMLRQAKTLAYQALARHKEQTNEH